VAEDEWQRYRHLATKDRHVGVAYTTRSHPYHHVMRAWGEYLDVLDGQAITLVEAKSG
jgi:hypothetical protein